MPLPALSFYTQRFSRLSKRIVAFLFPMSDWRARLRTFRRSPSLPVWRFEDPELPPTAPWPPEWFPHVIERNADGKPFIRFLDTTSLISGRPCEGEAAVRCARCGIHLHVEETTMADNTSAPICPWCTPIS